MFTEAKFDIIHCDKCDISVSCNFTPGRGMGNRNSLLFLLPNTTRGDYNRGYGKGTKSKLISTYIEKYNFYAYTTALVKCISNSIPSEHEIMSCSNNHLKKELFDIKPKIIIPVGDIATKQFIDYTYFNQVVDKALVTNINNIETIIYPIYHPSYTSNDKKIHDIYNNSFDVIARMYQRFINPNYLLFI